MITRLLDLREKYNLSQKQVAEVIGTSAQYYQKYEKGIRPLPVDRLVILADFYHTSTDYILGRTDIYKPYSTPKKRRFTEDNSN